MKEIKTINELLNVIRDRKSIFHEVNGNMKTDKSKLKAQKKQLDIPVIMCSVWLVVANAYEDDIVYFIGQTEKDAKYFIKHIYNGIHDKDEMIIHRHDVIHYT